MAVAQVLLGLACTEPHFTNEDGGTDAAGGDGSHAPMEQEAGPADVAGDGDGDGDAPGDASQVTERTDGGIAATPSLCGTPAAASSLGQDCAGVVECGNAHECDVTKDHCCLVFGGFGDACGSSPCENNWPVLCDGPEDCQQGQSCCFQGGPTSCQSVCDADKVLCHQDSACPSGKCVKGRPDLQFGVLWAYWGFCAP
ncbi:MAG: hypothetical protein QM778_16400 [Myxococcales bacterium]